ncbi:DUF3822 family protein [Parapedobacter defluvii]|uniref:DUF3822 family protein n=1 Tax=Parapedobacter defluvii TaxID=2045106 RepID=UPI00269425BD
MIYLSKFVIRKGMVMIYTSTDFDREQTAEYTLLVRIGSGENALAVVDGEKRLKLITTYDPAAAGQEITDLLDLNFTAVKLSLQGSRYTFIPQEVFDEASTQLYLNHLPYDGLAETVTADIAPLSIKMLHQIDRLGAESFLARFPGILTYSAMQALLQSTANYGLKTGDPLLIIDKQESDLMVCFFDGNRFVYANDFAITGIDDNAYYLYAVLEHLGGGECHPRVCLSGNIAEGDGIHQWALMHGIDVVFADSGALVGIAIPTEIVPQQHRFLTLLGLHLCE